MCEQVAFSTRYRSSRCASHASKIARVDRASSLITLTSLIWVMLLRTDITITRAILLCRSGMDFFKKSTSKQETVRTVLVEDFQEHTSLPKDTLSQKRVETQVAIDPYDYSR